MGLCPFLGVSENYLLSIQGKFVINLVRQFEEIGFVWETWKVLLDKPSGNDKKERKSATCGRSCLYEYCKVE